MFFGRDRDREQGTRLAKCCRVVPAITITVEAPHEVGADLSLTLLKALRHWRGSVIRTSRSHGGLTTSGSSGIQERGIHLTPFGNLRQV